jgi:hypothetical protein
MPWPKCLPRTSRQKLESPEPQLTEPRDARLFALKLFALSDASPGTSTEELRRDVAWLACFLDGLCTLRDDRFRAFIDEVSQELRAASIDDDVFFDASSGPPSRRPSATPAFSDRDLWATGKKTDGAGEPPETTERRQCAQHAAAAATPPPEFPPELICAPEPNTDQERVADDLYARIQQKAEFTAQAAWLDRPVLHRYLRARQYDVNKALALLHGTLVWRGTMRPDTLRAVDMETEAVTGKIRHGTLDRHGRPIVVLDNTVENHVSGRDGQMRFLVFNFTRAERLMKPGVDKYVVFIHLENFSFMNMPPMATTLETCNIVLFHFPERLGHCILYQPPRLFSGTFAIASRLMDAVTRQKVIFVNGDVSAGSANDKLLSDVISPDWKRLTGAEQPVLSPKCSPGYRHEEYWPKILQLDGPQKTLQVDSNERHIQLLE